MGSSVCPAIALLCAYHVPTVASHQLKRHADPEYLVPLSIHYSVIADGRCVCAADVTFDRDGSYDVTVDSESFDVQHVSVVEIDNKTIFTCEVNGRMMRSNIVFDKDTIHLFTLVCGLLFLQLRCDFNYVKNISVWLTLSLTTSYWWFKNGVASIFALF